MGQWAALKKPALTVTLVEASGDGSAPAGLMAVAEGPGADFCGPLTEAPFWAGDLAALSGLLPALSETGRLAEAGGRRYYLAPLAYNRSALVLGGGHVGGALAGLLRFLDFEVTLVDDRAEFLSGRDDGVVTVEASFAELGRRFPAAAFEAVVIVTRGHAQDTICLRQILAWSPRPPYLGMIGSRKRTAETLQMLAEEGFPGEALSRVHTPVGLKIGAQTPQEIAVSIAAEIIQVLNGA